MEEKIDKIIIATDGFPLEEIKGKPFVNFIRRWLHGDHKECRECYQHKTSMKVV